MVWKSLLILPGHRQEGRCYLLLEEILEGLAGVVVTRRCDWNRLRFLRVGGGGGGLFYCGAKFVKSAIVLGVLGGDALGDRLGALELGAGIEEAALLAAV